MSNREITQTSKDIYSKNLIRLNDNEPIKNYNFLKKTDDILKKIEHLKPNSRRTYLISIVSTLKSKPELQKIYKFYYDKMMELNKDLKVNNTKCFNSPVLFCACVVKKLLAKRANKINFFILIKLIDF